MAHRTLENNDRFETWIEIWISNALDAVMQAAAITIGDAGWSWRVSISREWHGKDLDYMLEKLTLIQDAKGACCPQLLM